jgi:4-hydroxy-3-methylbut-2-en-1-yl diphosphate reductase
VKRVVYRARTAGFCMGVALALKKLDKALEDHPGLTTYTYGPIIHNPQVLEHYSRLGVRETLRFEEIATHSLVIIRAHGIPKPAQDALSQIAGILVDATCPKVKKAQMLISEQVREGRTLLLFGERDHPEVRGLLSYAGNDALVFESLEKLRALDLPPDRCFFLAAQTTQDRNEFEAVKQILRERLGEEIPVLNTICDATRQRQAEARKIAGQVELMIVVGGFQSGNTRRLVQVVRDTGTRCIHVESAEQIPQDSVQGAKRIGLTAGASTPRWVIDRVETTLWGTEEPLT